MAANHARMHRASAWRVVLALAVLGVTAAYGTQQVRVRSGVFFEAEDYDGRPWYGDEGFGRQVNEALGSGGAVLIGMWKPGAVSYRLNLDTVGKWHVWMRCAVPESATVKFGANATSEATLKSVTVAGTTTKSGLSSAGAYQWRRLGPVNLREGANTFLLGQGAQRPDCFFLATDAKFTADDTLLTEVRQGKEAPKGKRLPELHHERRITKHPKWLTEHALRPAYAHFEWDRSNTPQSWARRAREAGANCLVGVGELPAGTLNGHMKPFAFPKIDQPDFAYPAGYRAADHSWVREFVDAGHAEGLKVVMYGGSWRTLDPILLEHPEWRQLDVNGKRYDNGFGSWHSPYRDAYIARWVRVAREYGIDGIMVDMLFTAPSGGTPHRSPWKHSGRDLASSRHGIRTRAI